VATGALDREGRPVRVACSNCHTTKTPRRETVSGEQLKVFHEGLTTRHGAVSCLSCHNATDYDSLHRADGSRLAFVDVMELCGQCHGPQRRDYDAGAHGGMTGYWDLSRGDRTRNSCVDCHNPHAPAYPKVWPVFKPAKDNR
jgi:formate-dependent nitrite reductase cytochrome c552 subunit